MERDRERSSRKLASRRLAEIGRRLPPDRFRGLDRVGMAFTMALAADNLIRIPKLLAQAA